MKNLLVIYNVMFLLVGNILFSNIHYMCNLDHHHNHNSENYDCDECIVIKNSNNYDLNFQNIKFSNNITALFINEYFSAIIFNVQERCLSRAPPIF